MAKSGKKGEQHFAKHPLADAIMKTVDKWAKDNYPAVDGNSISTVTRELFDYWFDDDIHEDYRFHICQRRAIETVAYCYEILNQPLPLELFKLFGEAHLKDKGLTAEVEKLEFPRYAVKMATGTGKTWVINAVIVWQYFNRIKANDKKFSSHFLLVAPGNIVYDRLLDSFLGKIKNGKRNKLTSDLENELFIPPHWKNEFKLRILTKEDITSNVSETEEPFILITNWHQLTDTSKKKKSLSEDLGIEFKDDSDSYRAQKFFDFLTFNSDLTVVNDEAHHLHNASDKDLKRWQDSIERIYSEINKIKNGLFVQFDFTATPYVIKGKKKEWMKHVVYDYGLVEAMKDMLVKQLFIEKSSYLTERLENLSENEEYSVKGHRDEARNLIALNEIQKHMLSVGLAKLEQLEGDFKELNIKKKPVMFVVAYDTKEAESVAQYLRKKVNDIDEKQVAVIHTNKKNIDSLTDEEYTELKQKIFASDDYDSEIRIIVSVLMLREGFDVRNVCVLVALRPSDSDLLTEQILGRGIRLMFTEPEYQEAKQESFQHIENSELPKNSYDFLFVVEHPKFNQIYKDLKEAGATITTEESKKLTLDSERIIVKVDESRIPKYELYLPISLNEVTEENIDFSTFDIPNLPTCRVPFDSLEPKSIIITDYHTSTKFKKDWEFENKEFSYSYFLRAAAIETIGESKNMSSVTRYFNEIVGIIDQYVSEVLFGRTIDFNIPENAEKLKNMQLFDFIISNVRKALTQFITKKAKTHLEINWNKLSEFSELKINMNRAYKTRNCIYPMLDFGSKGGFERRFVEQVLEKDSGVTAYVKLDQYVHKFGISYTDSKGFLGKYYPDFIVKTIEENLIIETKSEKDAYNDIDVLSKMKAAQQYCTKISKAINAPENQAKIWRYVLVPENIAKDLEGQSFKAVIRRSEDFMSNLIWKGQTI